MQLFHRLVEIVLGTVLLWWTVPRVLACARATQQSKCDLALPRYDTPEYPQWIGVGGGVALGIVFSIWLSLSQPVNVVLIVTLCIGITMYLEEWLTRQALPHRHPWRSTVEEVASDLGIEPGEISYRQCSEISPYACLGGITLPSKALRSLDEAALRYMIAQALIARRRRREWSNLRFWLFKRFVAYSMYLAYFLEPHDVTYYDASITYSIVSIVLMLLWTRKIPVCVRDDSFAVDCEALTYTGNFEAACRAIQKRDAAQNASQRISWLKGWWEKYQREQTMKAGTLAAIQPSNQKVQPLDRTP